jgi:hypothetical protein
MGRKQETGRVHVLWERKKVSSHHTGLGRGGFESELVHLCSGRIKGFEGPVDWSREDFCTGSYRFGRAKMTSWNCDCDLVVQIRSPDVLRIGIVIFRVSSDRLVLTSKVPKLQPIIQQQP